jgi:hypothetical protein
MEFFHEFARKLLRPLVGDLAVVGDEPGLELYVGFRSIICGELQKLSMLRRCCWPTAMPMAPGDVPITADGLRANEFVP